MRPHPFALVAAFGALLGIVFAAYSTYDFMVHLDRQVHGIHCSYLPGIVATDENEATGCQAALMSPYSSIMRERIWGGLPVSLPGLSVFAFLLFWIVNIILSRRQEDSYACGFFLAFTLIPLITSVVMAYLAITELQELCKVCVGMYVASIFLVAGALGLFIRARQARARSEQSEADTSRRSEPLGLGGLALGCALALAFLLIPLATYASIAPGFDQYVGSCGTLLRPTAEEGVLVHLEKVEGGTPAIEILDPLCPACRNFDGRLNETKLSARLDRYALLFPLDNECNWMLDRSLHPGACAVSEAVLCAGDNAQEVVQWAFSEQEALVQAATNDPNAARQRAAARFPALRECIGSPGVQARLNRGLRWAVHNQLPVLAPQLYLNGVRLCDEDTDLGLEFMLARLLQHVGTMPRQSRPIEPELERQPVARPVVRDAGEETSDSAASGSEHPDELSASPTGDAGPSEQIAPATPERHGDENAPQPGSGDDSRTGPGTAVPEEGDSPSQETPPAAAEPPSPAPAEPPSASPEAPAPPPEGNQEQGGGA